MKQIFSFMLWEELQNYKSELPLLQLIKYKVQTAWQEYVRMNCGNFQIDNRHQYLLLKKIAYLYYRKKGKNNSQPKYNADFYASDDEDDFYSSAVDSVANDLDTEALYFKLLRQEKLNIALADLRKPDRLLVEYVYGICPKCLLNKKRKTLREASLLLGCLFSAHKPRQIACVGFVGRGRVRAPPILSSDTGRNRERQVFPLLIASTISLTAKEKPRQNASRSPRFISSVWLSLIFWSMTFCCSVSVADNSCS
nr:hypothetical protein [uncultured Ruminococcus sp.]